MYRLPNELVHQIFNSIADTETIKTLRLTCKPFSAIGAEYLIPEAHVICTRDSLERLHQIALHGTFSKHVTSLLFEGDIVSHYCTRAQWEGGLPPLHSSRNRLLPVRAFRHIIHQLWPYRPVHTMSERSRAYRNYRKMEAQQREIIKKGLDLEIIAYAIKRFPRLATIRVSINAGIAPRTPYFKSIYEPCLLGRDDGFNLDIIHGHRYGPPGYHQLCAIFLGLFASEHFQKEIYSANYPYLPVNESPAKKVPLLHLQRLHLGSVDWRILLDPRRGFTAVCHDMVSQVKDLKLIVSADQSLLNGLMSAIQTCQVLLRSTRSLLRFLEGATEVEILYVEFTPFWPVPLGQAADLASIVGKNTWKHLQRLHIRGFKTSEYDLLAFLKRHRRTLQHYELSNIALDTGASWQEILPKIRDITRWQDAQIYEWLMDSDGQTGYRWSKPEWKGSPTDFGQKIQEYLTGKVDENPLMSVDSSRFAL
ncbi:MAG: hypothetical protein M1834_006779 [Cirrosporium novae-zelandiae]|nr:MAG: hypothetical protein M1834_006779 [Cirrosporium novae-zelandiae]